MKDRKDIDAIKKAYKRLFESGEPLKEVANDLLETSDNEFVLSLAKFVNETKRGIPFVRKKTDG
jgi:UDP-N-acetylglucosamine acyltransferase